MSPVTLRRAIFLTTLVTGSLTAGRRAVAQIRSGVHPRVRGEHLGNNSVPVPTTGSSPRARGTLEV
jgi:hypothetical protein